MTADLPTPPASPSLALPPSGTSAPLPGTFISFEGGDGVGKSTQLALLREWLAGLGREVVVTREPGGTALGLELRQAVLHGDHAAAALILHAIPRVLTAAPGLLTVLDVPPIRAQPPPEPALARAAIMLNERWR